jgi:hypothetical protein
MVLKVMETLKNIGFLFEKINPCKFAEIIGKTHIIFVLIDRIGCRTPHIQKKQVLRDSMKHSTTLDKEVDNFWPFDRHHTQTHDSNPWNKED